AFCTDSTKISLTSATSTVTTASVTRASPMGHAGSLGSACSALAKISRCVLSENSKPKPYPAISSTAKAAEFLGQRRGGHQISFGDCRGTHQRNRGQEQKSRVETGSRAVIFLDVVRETANKKRCSQHEQRVGHNRAGYGTFHQRIFAGTQR